MKRVVILFVIFVQFALFVLCTEKDYKFFPNLPAGEYVVYFKAYMVCYQDADMQFNLFLSKTSSTAIELKGNITNWIPFDDTNDLNVMMSVKDSIGGWKDNAFVYKTPKACTSLKLFLGTEFTEFFKAFGFEKPECPLAPGVHLAKYGYNITDSVQKMNFPKTFFYGTYKFRLYYTDSKKTTRGCMIFIIELKRPWETV